MTIKSELNDALGIFFDERFEYDFRKMSARTHGFDLDDAWNTSLSGIKDLFNRRKRFFQRFDYQWALEKDSYNYPHEVYLQLAALNCISDIDDSHPKANERNDIVVRVIPNSSARPHVRLVGNRKVVVLTRGYSSAMRGFLRLWMRGCALGGSTGGFDVRNAERYRQFFLAGAKKNREKMELSTRAYVGNLLQLQANDFPSMDQSSVFDEHVNSRDKWGVHFSALVGASDIFLLFHELAHILSLDYTLSDRTLDNEMMTDEGAASLCIVAAANRDFNAFHALAFGSVVYFNVETLRLLTFEVKSLVDRSRRIDEGRLPGIEEMLERGSLFHKHIVSNLGTLGRFHYESHMIWRRALQQPFNAVRWALLDSVGRGSAGHLDDFLISTDSA